MKSYSIDQNPKTRSGIEKEVVQFIKNKCKIDIVEYRPNEIKHMPNGVYCYFNIKTSNFFENTVLVDDIEMSTMKYFENEITKYAFPFGQLVSKEITDIINNKKSLEEMEFDIVFFTVEDGKIKLQKFYEIQGEHHSVPVYGHRKLAETIISDVIKFQWGAIPLQEDNYLFVNLLLITDALKATII